MTRRLSYIVFTVLFVVLAGCTGGAEFQATDTTDTITDRTSETSPITKTPEPTSAVCKPTKTDTATSTPAKCPVNTSTPGQTEQPPDEPSGTTTDAPSTKTATPEPTRSPTATATATPESTSTATPASTPTPEPTKTTTPKPTTTTTPEPTGTPADDGGADTLTGRVVAIVDGDTIKVNTGGEVQTVRLLGVDTPETSSSNEDPSEFGVTTQAGEECLLEHAETAKLFTDESLNREQVTLRFDSNEPRTDVFGRTLAYVYVNGELFNDDLVKQGHARVYTEANAEVEDEFLQYEQQAQNANKGLWECNDGSQNTETPTPSDPSQNTLSVSVNEDAPGNDNNNKNGEWVEITNTRSQAVNLNGYTLSDEAGHTYTFSDVTLSSGETIRLYTGSGSDTESELYWNYGGATAVWNNGGDTVIIQDANGNVVVEHTY